MHKDILFIGSGAIACLYASQCAKDITTSVSLLCRTDYETISTHGVHIIHPSGSHSHFTPTQVLKMGAPSSETYDYIIVCTKVLNTPYMIQLIRPFLRQGSTIVLIQNGIHIEPPYKRAFPDHHLISGLAFVCVTRTSSGHIHHQDYGKLTLGTYPNQSSAHTHTLANSFNQGGGECTVSECIAKDRFIKLLWNASFNPLSVIKGGKTTQLLLEDSDTVHIIRSIMQEVSLLSNAEGYPLNPKLIDQMITNTYSMTPYKTSMLIDYERGYPLEIDAILGQCLLLARQHNIDIPYIRDAYESLVKLT